MAHDDDPDEIELNGTDLKNNNDVKTYSQTFLSEGKSITKINQEEEERKNSLDDTIYDKNKAIDDISKSVQMKQLNKTPMIENDNRSTHIELTVPKNPEKPVNEQKAMTRVEMANTLAWARKDEIDQARMPRNAEYNLQTQKMNINEKSDLFH